MAFRDPIFDDYYRAAASSAASARSAPFSRLFDQNFGLTLDDDELVIPSFFRRPRRLHTRQQSGVSQVQQDKENYQVMLDVQQFRPRELTVKTVGGFVVVEGKHEEREDEHGFISRQFTRRYVLPEDVKAENVECNLSSDGVLMITGPRSTKETEPSERPIWINQTGRPAMKKDEQKDKPASTTESSQSAGTEKKEESNNTSSSASDSKQSGETRTINISLG